MTTTKQQMDKLMSPDDMMMPQEPVTKEKVTDALKTAGTFIAESTPGLGEVLIAKDIAKDIKDEQYLSAGLNTLALGVGAIPGAGDILNKPIRVFAKKIRKADEQDAKRLLDDPDTLQAWRDDPSNKVDKAEKKRRETRKYPEQAQALESGLMSGPEYRRYIRENQPATKFTLDDLQTMVPTFKDTVGALGKSKASKGIVGLNKKIKKGTIVDSRLDIPAYNDYNTWVASMTLPNKGGNVYGRTAVLKNVDFSTSMSGEKILKIAKDEKTKTPMATMKGEWQDLSDEEAFDLAQKYLADPKSGYVQVGFNPERHSFFYDKDTMMPIFEAEEVIQIGALVLAKPKLPKTAAERAARIGKLRELKIENTDRVGRPATFNEGGLSVDDQMDDAFMSPDDMMMPTEKVTKEQAIDAAKDVGLFAAESTPVVGEILAAKRVGDAIEEKDYATAAIEATAGLLGIIPGVGDLAGRGVRKVGKAFRKDNTPSLKSDEQKRLEAEARKIKDPVMRRDALKNLRKPTPKVFHASQNMARPRDAVQLRDNYMRNHANSEDFQRYTMDNVFNDYFGEMKGKSFKEALRQDMPLMAVKVTDFGKTITPDYLDLRLQPKEIGTSKLSIKGDGGETQFSDTVAELVDEEGVVHGEIPLYKRTVQDVDGTRTTEPGIKKADIKEELDRINAESIKQADEFFGAEAKYTSKADELEAEGFAPYEESGELAGSSRRRKFRGDESAFGQSQSGTHIELKGIKALSTSRDPLVSTKDVFGDRVLANLVYADLPKNVQRNISPDEYAELISNGAVNLRDEILEFGSPVSLPKSSHLEAEVALPRPQELNVKRLSEDRNRIDPKQFDVKDMKPTKGTGKLPLAERIAEGQRLVNRLFSQLDRLEEASPAYAKAPRRFYNYTKNMFNDAQSLAKYTEQYGARGTYDSFLETVANNGRYVTNLKKFANAMPGGERQNNLKALADVLETMAYKDRAAPIRAKTATREMSDKDIDSILFDRPKELDIDDVLHEYGYNDLKRMAFHVTQKLNTGGLVQMNEGGAVPMKKQMELFEPVERGFDEGGLLDEGGMVDEKSGNEVPPGSTKKEVRDDIPAQLSEGEFVFPADVVRYIGLEKLMMMRQEAKQGLAQMEAMGQMGNGDEATVQDDLPFDMYDLDIEDEREYNVGGFVPGQTGFNPATGTVQTPGNVGLSTYQQPFNTMTTGFTPNQPIQPYFQPVQFTQAQYQQPTDTMNIPTFQDLMGSSPGQYDEFRTYVNDAGQVMQIPFKDGKPIYPIPEGYSEQGEPAAEAPPAAPQLVQSATVPDDKGRDVDDPLNNMDSTKDVTGIGYTYDKLSPAMKDLVDKYGAGFGTLKDAFNPQLYETVAAKLGITEGVPSKTNALTSASFSGILSNFRGFKTGQDRFERIESTGANLNVQGLDNIDRLEDFTSAQVQELAQVTKAVIEGGVISGVTITGMRSLFENEDGSAKTNKEVRDALEAEAIGLGVQTKGGKDGKGNWNRSLTTIANDIAARKAQIAKAAIQEGIAETARQVAAAEKAKMEAAIEKGRREGREDASPGDEDYDTRTGAEAVAAQGGPDRTSGGMDSPYKSGGLVKQMKQSGLASKK